MVEILVTAISTLAVTAGGAAWIYFTGLREGKQQQQQKRQQEQLHNAEQAKQSRQDTASRSDDDVRQRLRDGRKASK